MGKSTRTIVRRTKEEQREASIEKLLSAARHQFVSKGYTPTTLDDIAASVAMTKGSVYFYFKSKEAVLIEVLKQAERVVVDHAVTLLQHPVGTSTEKLVRFFHHQAKLGVSDRENMLLIILMSLEFENGLVAKKVTAIYRKLYKALEALIATGQKAGEFRKDSHPRELASIVVANHDGTFIEWYRRHRELNGAALTRALRLVALQGLSRLEGQGRANTAAMASIPPELMGPGADHI